MAASWRSGTSDAPAWAISGTGPNSASYSRLRSGSVAIRRASSMRSRLSSAAASIGPAVCAHRLSARPSQKNQRLYATFQTEGVFRSTPGAKAAARPSARPSSITWQVAQERLRSRDRRTSKNRFLPKSIAGQLPDTALVGSRAGSSRGESDNTIVRSCGVNSSAAIGTPAASISNAGTATSTRAGAPRPLAACRFARMDFAPFDEEQSIWRARAGHLRPKPHAVAQQIFQLSGPVRASCIRSRRPRLND